MDYLNIFVRGNRLAKKMIWKNRYFRDLGDIYSRRISFSEKIRDILSTEVKKSNFKEWSDFPKKIAREHYGIEFPHETPSLALQEVFMANIYFSFPEFIPEKGETVVDAGSQYGDYSLLCSKVYGAGKVISFEPLEHIYDAFVRAVQMNSVNNIEIHNAAVSSSDSTVEIHNFDGQMGSKFGNSPTKAVKSVKLDSVVSGQVDILKIDVEGFEIDALEGARRIIKENHPKIIIEVHSRDLKRKTLNLLEEYEYIVIHEGRKAYSTSGHIDMIQNLYLY